MLIGPGFRIDSSRLSCIDGNSCWRVEDERVCVCQLHMEGSRTPRGFFPNVL